MRLAVEVSDAEAEAAAIALRRGWTLATDDRKARRVALGIDPGLTLCGTTNILFRWQRQSRRGDGELARVLRSVQERARSCPHRADALRAWWDRLAALES